MHVTKDCCLGFLKIIRHDALFYILAKIVNCGKSLRNCLVRKAQKSPIITISTKSAYRYRRSN